MLVERLRDQWTRRGGSLLRIRSAIGERYCTKSGHYHKKS
jgi:hypothetical protein